MIIANRIVAGSSVPLAQPAKPNCCIRTPGRPTPPPRPVIPPRPIRPGRFR